MEGQLKPKPSFDVAKYYEEEPEPGEIKTSEEILKKHSDNRYCMQFPFGYSELYAAMEQYAQQFKAVSLPDEAVELLYWITWNNYKWEIDELAGYVWYQDNEEGKSQLTTSQHICELFKQSKEVKEQP